MKLKQARSYSMEKREAAAVRTEKKILNALAELWLEYSIHEITMERIAERAGITVRTILRKFGSKEGLYEAALIKDIAGIKNLKDQTRVGDVDHIAEILMEEYERTGMASVRTLALEPDLKIAAEIVKIGRLHHTNWCERVFEPYLPGNGKERRIMIGALYASTDVNIWKLLRRDLGYSETETLEILKRKINGTIHAFKQQEK